MNSETCEITWMQRKTCFHCHRPPRYQLRKFVYNGNRMVEVLRDGGPVHVYDRHFQFGWKKAELLLAALPIIQEFANSPDDGTTKVTSQIVLELRAPEVRVGPRGRQATRWAGVPKASVNKDDLCVTREDKVGFSWKLFLVKPKSVTQ